MTKAMDDNTLQTRHHMVK